MFIKQKDYEALIERLNNLEHKFAEFESNETGVLFGFSGDIDKLKSDVSGLAEESEAIQKSRAQEKAFFDGFTNIMAYTGDKHEEG